MMCNCDMATKHAEENRLLMNKSVTCFVNSKEGCNETACTVLYVEAVCVCV